MAGDRLSITGCRQPTDCGCSSFHPTIESEAFILSTLAIPVPSHDITREFSQFSGVMSLSQLLLGSCSLQLRAFSFGYGLGEVSQMLFHIKLATFVRDSAGASPLQDYALPSRVSSPFCIPLTLEGFVDLSCSFCQKEAQVCRSLRCFGLTTHVSIHGGG
jgi:hypothetical protein